MLVPRIYEASLSGTFLKTAMLGYATEGALDVNFRAAVHRRCQRPPKGLGTNKTETQESKIAWKHAACLFPPLPFHPPPPL